jgi:hypothetical protein
MAAARPHIREGSGSSGGDGGSDAPLPFQHAVAALTSAHPRPEVELSQLPAPKRLAPYAFALAALVTGTAHQTAGAAGGPAVGGPAADEELAGGRFVLLYDPEGQESWQGAFRVVTLTRAELEPEMAADPLLPEVSWSWLTGALEARSAAYTQPSGTVTRSSSSFFGGLDSRPPRTELELRASWTPVAAGPGGPGGPEAEPDVTAHLAAWGELLCQCAGLPPEHGDGGAVVQLPQRRGPQPL